MACWRPTAGRPAEPPGPRVNMNWNTFMLTKFVPVLPVKLTNGG